MKHVIFISLFVVFSLLLGAQVDTTNITKHSFKTFAELGSWSYQDAARVLKPLGLYAPVGSLFIKTSYGGVYIWGYSGIDLSSSRLSNPNANYIQFASGYVLEKRQFSFDVNVSLFLGGVGDKYLEVDTEKRLLIPNVYTKYTIRKDKSSLGLWTNYFDSPDGSAWMLRGDWSLTTPYGNIQVVAAYSGGPFDFDAGINGGIRYSGKLADISKKISLHAQFNVYKNIKEYGENPFTQNTFGGGLSMQFSNKGS